LRTGNYHGGKDNKRRPNAVGLGEEEGKGIRMGTPVCRASGNPEDQEKGGGKRLYEKK